MMKKIESDARRKILVGAMMPEVLVREIDAQVESGIALSRSDFIRTATILRLQSISEESDENSF